MYKNPSTDEQEKDLFVSIFRQLSASKDPYQSISGILKDICEFFGFYCGFVYEADHAQVFHLHEYNLNHGVCLTERFSLTDFLDTSDIDELVRQAGEIVYLNSRKNKMGAKFLGLFSARTLVMVPAIIEDKYPIAFVGLMDRRKPIRLGKQEIDDADAVLSVLAGHIKMRALQRRLEYAHRSMKNIVDNAGLDIYVNDYYTGEILFANESLAASYGGADQLMGKKCPDIFSGERCGNCTDCPRKLLLNKEGMPVNVYSQDFKRQRDGCWFRVIHTAFPWVDGRLAHLSSSINITENKHNEELILRMAEQDTLTCLPNRRKFLADMDAHLSFMKTGGGEGYLLFMDLDDFKIINDTMGHLAGDMLLSSIGKFLIEGENLLGKAYRYGGDEFVIIATEKTEEDLKQIKDMLLSRFGGEWQLQGVDVCCGISIGAIKFTGADNCIDELIRRADAAMYAVKRKGKRGFLLDENT